MYRFFDKNMFFRGEKKRARHTFKTIENLDDQRLERRVSLRVRAVKIAVTNDNEKLINFFLTTRLN